MPERAIIYVPHDDMEQCAILCLEYAAQAGYDVQGVVVGRWRDAQSMALDGAAEVVIVAERSQLPPDRAPRIEVVAEHLHDHDHDHDDDPEDEQGPPTSRRPKVI